MKACLFVLAALEKPEIFGPLAPPEPLYARHPEVAATAAGATCVVLAASVLFFVNLRRAKRAAAAKHPRRILEERLAALSGKTVDESYLRELSSLLHEALSTALERDFHSLSAEGIRDALGDTPEGARSAKALAVLRQCELLLYSGTGKSEEYALISPARDAVSSLFDGTNPDGTTPA